MGIEAEYKEKRGREMRIEAEYKEKRGRETENREKE